MFSNLGANLDTIHCKSKFLNQIFRYFGFRTDLKNLLLLKVKQALIFVKKKNVVFIVRPF